MKCALIIHLGLHCLLQIEGLGDLIQELLGSVVYLIFTGDTTTTCNPGLHHQHSLQELRRIFNLRCNICIAMLSKGLGHVEIWQLVNIVLM